MYACVHLCVCKQCMGGEGETWRNTPMQAAGQGLTWSRHDSEGTLL